MRNDLLVVEGDNPLGRTAFVGDNEFDVAEKLSRVPFDLGDHQARLGPASRPIAEVSRTSLAVVRPRRLPSASVGIFITDMLAASIGQGNGVTTVATPFQ